MANLKEFSIDFVAPNSMPGHIESLIDRSYEGLLSFIEVQNEAGIGLCVLKNVNFMLGFTPDYTDAGQCSLYLLRYGAAYTVEYRAAYDEILRTQRIIPGDVCVLSIGCGTCLDKASAFFAMEQYLEFKSKELIYYGVDIARWDVDVFDEVETNFIHKGIQDVESADINSLIDIIFFPKSLSEIEECWLDDFLENMTEDDFEDRISIVASNRNSLTDNTKASNFVTKFCEKFDFNLENSIRIQKNYKTEREYSNIWSVFEHFSYPQRAIDAGSNPKSLCILEKKCNESSCEERLNRSVTLNTTLFNTVVYCLEKC